MVAEDLRLSAQPADELRGGVQAVALLQGQGVQATQLGGAGSQGRQGRQHGTQVRALGQVRIQAALQAAGDLEALGIHPGGPAAGGGQDLGHGAVPLGVSAVQRTRP